ncbi:ribonuclease HI family protein [Leifsonia sp. ZF2019]|uniref:ribonuclease HI family protein n=1 Tax=Leifsonia sp. ZF2019 TaxID=2781978 RepID=UPI001CBC2692|nr:ribonuclease HI family protein [Leifsonia sp. ZF2019]UAJ78071.1 ribonuclease HI family protein [Leifsonia sp. ZF2019]
MTIVAAADGSALGNPGPAGWAWYVDDDCWSAGGWPHGTNNQGELMAVIDLLESTAHLDDDLRILCDSQYVINAVTKWMAGWKRKGWRKADGAPVLNRELLERLDRALQGRRYSFEWVKGHAGHDLNEAADARARAVATAYQKGDPIPIGPGWPHAPQKAVTASDAVRADDVPDATAATAPSPSLATPEPALELDIFGDLAAAETDEELVARLESELLDPAVRSDASRVAELLHPDFEEIGRSGRLWGRDEMLQALADEESAPIEFDVLNTASVADGVILLTARTMDARGGSLRSSLWQRTGGRWRLRFHQGTPEA